MINYILDNVYNKKSFNIIKNNDLIKLIESNNGTVYVVSLKEDKSLSKLNKTLISEGYELEKVHEFKANTKLSQEGRNFPEIIHMIK